MSKSEQVTLKHCLIGGVILSICSISAITLIVAVLAGIRDGFPAAVAGFGIALLLAGGAMLLAPLFGVMVSLRNRSWSPFKFWTGAGAVSMVLNAVIGLASLALAELL